jgi:dTDP-4-amino-4,6-dideoxygalactose transaminase
MSKLAIHGGQKTNTEDHVKWPLINERDKEFVMKAVEEGILWGVFAPQVKGLEKEWGEYVGTKHCLSCNSGTAGLHMAVAAAGIGPGDEVITPSLTFVASAMCALQANAIPVFVDVDPRTFCMDPKLIEAKITEKTKAIIPVDLHGITADMDEINAIAKKHHLVVIADACQSHGATYKGRKAGTLADMSVFSLNGLKNLPGADGGLFNTDSDEYNEKANQVRIFGEKVVEGMGRDYNSRGIGWMYRYQELPAAFTRSRLIDLDSDNAVRRQNAEYLTEHLKGMDGIITPYIPEDRTSVYHYYRIRFDAKKAGLNISSKDFRVRVQKALIAEGIQAQRWQTKPVQLQTLFQEKTGYGKGCPWSCPYGSGTMVEYGPEDYIETQKILDDSIVIYDAIYPPNDIRLMERYVEAFRKLWTNMDELLKIEVKSDDIWLRD